MTNALHNALFWAVVVVVMAVLAAVPFFIALWFGLAWAIIASAALAGLIGWQCGKAGMAAGVIAFPAWSGVAAGLIVAVFFKLYGVIAGVLS